MSLFSALNVSLSGLQAATTQMQLVANNIANAGQEGYTRKSIIQSAVTLGTEGGGTIVSGYTRATDDTLQETLNDAASDAGLRDAQNEYLQQVENLLDSVNSTSPALSSAISKFASAWRQMSAEPESNVQQQQVIQAASNLASTVRKIAASIESLDRQAHDDINTTISDLNANLASIVDLNVKISQAVSAGQSAGNLEDERDRLVQEVASVMNVTIMQRPQGQIALYTPGGYTLVDGAAQAFEYNGTTVYTTGNPSLSLNNVLTGGRLEALINFRADSSPAAVSAEPTSEVIRKLRSQLDEVVTAFTEVSAGPPESFAYAYNNAVGEAGELADSFFTGADRMTFAVNTNLLDSSATVKTASATDVSDTFNSSGRSFSADGLNITGASYETLATNILTVFQQASTSIDQLNETASDLLDYLKQRYANQTGVNVDTETVALTTLQNAYAACAHVMAIIQEMFTILENLTR